MFHARIARVVFGAADLLATSAVGARCDYLSSDAEMARGSASFVVARAGQLHGIAAWFVAGLSATVTMTNAPDSRDRMFRKNAPN